MSDNPPDTVAQPMADITGLVLAGGRARRMGGEDKGLIMLADKTMLEHVLEGLRPQVGTILVSANRNLERYEAFGHLVVVDRLKDYCGPLAGMASGMKTAETDYLLSVPCDSPFVPAALASRLYQTLTEARAEICVAHDGMRLQPVFALIKTSLLSSMEIFLASGERKIDRWYALHHTVTADFSDMPQAFLNVNTPEQHSELETAIKQKK